MIIKREKNIKKSPPKIGDIKYKNLFAFFPRKLENGDWIWLQKYTACYEYKEFYYEYDVIVSEGLITEKYYTDIAKGYKWKVVSRKTIP